MTEKKAYVGKKISNKGYVRVELGTEEGVACLQNPKINAYIADLDYEQEMTLFVMHRRKDGIWIAHPESKPKIKYVIGKSSEINYKNIIKVWKKIQG